MLEVFRGPLDFQVGLLDWLSAGKLASCTALGLQVELLRALGASKLGSRGRSRPPSEPQMVSKSYGSYRTIARSCGRQGSAAIFLVIHRIRSTPSIYLLICSSSP